MYTLHIKYLHIHMIIGVEFHLIEIIFSLNIF